MQPHAAASTPHINTITYVRTYNTIIDPTEYNWHLRDIHVVVPRIRSDPTLYSLDIKGAEYV